jgi:hypothetical protein
MRIELDVELPINIDLKWCKLIELNIDDNQNISATLHDYLSI